MSAAATLRQAAELVEQRAAETAQLAVDPWAPSLRRTMVPWVATMGPRVAGPLAAWLRGHADYCDAVPVTPEPNALALARAILGELT